MTQVIVSVSLIKGQQKEAEFCEYSQVQAYKYFKYTGLLHMCINREVLKLLSAPVLPITRTLCHLA